MATPDYVIEKAVDVWCNELRNPKFDNGDTSDSSLFSNSLQAKLCSQLQGEINLNEEIEKFRINLTDIIKKDVKEKSDPVRGYYVWLEVDYDPCSMLRKAIEGTKLHPKMFSIKSSVDIHDDIVSTRFGYGVRDTYYYRCEDKWVISKSQINEKERDILPLIVHGVTDGLIKSITLEDV